MVATWFATALLASLTVPHGRPATIFHVPENLEPETVRQLAASIQERVSAERKKGSTQRHVFILDFNPGGRPSRLTNLDSCLVLTRMIQGLDRDKVLTIGWIEGDLTGHGVLAALSCEDLVMGPKAALGPAHEGDGELDPIYKAAYEDAARRQGRSAIVARKLADPGTSIRRDPDARPGTDRFRDGAAFAGGEPVMESGSPGRFDRARALELGLCSADSPASLAAVLQRLKVDRDSVADFSSAAGPVVQINLRGEINGAMREKIARDIRRALGLKPEIVVLNLECHGGQPQEAVSAGEAARSMVSMAGPETPRLVAYLSPQARGNALILALACDAIVFDKQAKLGFEESPGAGDQAEGALAEVLAGRQWLGAADSKALASALARKEPALLAVRQAGGPLGLALGPPAAEARVDREIKRPGEWWLLNGDTASAVPFELCGAPVESLRSWYETRGISSKRLVIFEGSALDELALFLSHRGTTVLLVMLGLASLMVEFMKPGLAFPGVVAAVCFLLVFWAGSRLSGQIDWLAILLFLLGVVMLLMEILVIPGFGIVGLSGVVLMLCAVGLVAFGHWPRSQGEWLAYGHAVAPLGWSLAGAIAMVALFFRFLPGIPLLNHLMLHPDRLAEQETSGTAIYEEDRMLALAGCTGRTTTDLRPAGIARIGEMLVDVVSDGAYIEAGSRVVVCQVEGNRVVVRRADSPGDTSG